MGIDLIFVVQALRRALKHETNPTFFLPGRPLPQLRWIHENTVLDDSYTVTSEKKVKNILRLDKLQRHHLHAVLTCQASNNNVTTPISSAVTLNMNCKLFFI